MTSLVARGTIIFMRIPEFNLFKKKGSDKSDNLISKFPKNLNFAGLCSEALKQRLAGDLLQVKSEFGPLELNLDFHSGDNGFQINWMLEPGTETLKIPKGKILQFEISQPWQEALTMTYDPSENYNGGNFPIMKYLLPNASLQVKLVDKALSNQEGLETYKRGLGEVLSKKAA